MIRVRVRGAARHSEPHGYPGLVPTDELAPASAGTDTDPNDRVHHHARVGDQRKAGDRAILTLCGLWLDGPRPEAASLPCCPMCAQKMGAACR